MVYDVDRLRRDAFVVDHVGAKEAFAVELRVERIVDDANRFRKHTGFETGREGSGGAGGGSHLRAVGFDVGNEETGEYVGGGVSAEEDGTVVVLGGDYGSFAEFI